MEFWSPLARACCLVFPYILMFISFWVWYWCFLLYPWITRLRLTLPTRANQQRERKKFLTYASWTWGSSSLPTILACVVELTPLFPKSSLIRPNFNEKDGTNLTVILYIATFLAITCLANIIIFCYTSYRMILIQKSTALADNNTYRINTAKKTIFSSSYAASSPSSDGGALGDQHSYCCCFYRLMAIKILTNDSTDSHVVSHFTAANDIVGFFVL